jgi:hypothetical protein
MDVVSNGDIISGLRRPLTVGSVFTINSRTFRDSLKHSIECLPQIFVKLSIGNLEFDLTVSKLNRTNRADYFVLYNTVVNDNVYGFINY